MKTARRFSLLFLMALCAFNFSCEKEDHETAADSYYWADEKKIPLYVDDHKLVVKNVAGNKSVDAILDQLGAKEVSIESWEIKGIPGYFFLSSRKSLRPHFHALFNHKDIQCSFSYCLDTEKKEDTYVIPVGQVLFKLKEDVDLEKFKSKYAHYFGNNEMKAGVGGHFYAWEVSDLSKIMVVANKIYEDSPRLVEYCHPNFYSKIVLFD